jgi:heme oxygenase
LDMARLRCETAAEHIAVERSVPLMKSDLTKEEYVSTIGKIYQFVELWEERAAVEAPGWLREMLVARRRSSLLLGDLVCLNVVPTRPLPEPVLPPTTSEAGFLGAMYVMEGSTLGGQLIARHLEKTLGLAAGNGYSYFQGHGAETGRLWREFCDVLQTRVPDAESHKVIQAAQQMFRAFGAWMQGVNPEAFTADQPHVLS